MRRGFLMIAGSLLIISGIGGARAGDVLLAQYYRYPPPGYGYPPPCPAVTAGPFRGAAGAARRGAARSSGYCH